jgi:hypothetical protein
MLGCFKSLSICASRSSLVAISPLQKALFSFLMAQGERAAPLRGERS